MKPLTSFLASLVISIPTCLAAPQIDFDGDGLDDYLTVSIGTDQGLTWTYRGSATSSPIQLSALGKRGDNLAPGVWRKDRGSERVIISRDSSANTVWTIEGSESFILGNGQGTAIAGADVDNSGLLDAIFVSKRDGKLIWSIAIDPFDSTPAGGSAFAELEFGVEGELPFFANPLGAGDWLATLNQTTSTITFRVPSGTEQRQIVLTPDLAALGRPLPVAQPDGVDLLAFTEKLGGTTVIRALRMDGSTAAKNRLPATGTVIVGDFSGDYTGEEIAIQTSKNFKGYNPSSKKRITVRFATSIPVDSVNISEYGGVSADPGFQSCISLNPLDGAKHGFTWKPNSDTTYYAVAVMPGTLAGKVSKVEVFSSSGEFIKQLKFFGCGNPDSDGIRCNHKDFELTGKDYKRVYGSIILKVYMKDKTCGSYLLTDPSRRID